MIEFSRYWCMPNKNTFSIKPINDFVCKHLISESMGRIERPAPFPMKVIDPFANNYELNSELVLSPDIITNDLDPDMDTDYTMDALDFLKMFDDKSVHMVLFDPPYSPRQVSECYKKLGKTVNFQTTQASFWSKMKIEISRIVADNGLVLSFGWNSNGIGKTRGFNIEEIMLVAHGGHHNDTICVAERKVS